MRYTVIYEDGEWLLKDHDKQHKASFADRETALQAKELLETDTPEACKVYERLFWTPAL